MAVIDGSNVTHRSRKWLFSLLLLPLSHAYLSFMSEPFRTNTFQQSSYHRASFYHRASLVLSMASTETAPYLDKVREGISEAGFEESWKESAIVLSESVGMDVEAAEVCLAKVWNWKSWAVTTSNIARKYIKTVEPNPESVRESLEWLRTGPLMLIDNQFLQNAILESPEAYLDNPEKNYKQALEVAPTEFQDPDNFKRLLLEDPSVLQCTYNCVDDGCKSECGNCWVSFDNRK